MHVNFTVLTAYGLVECAATEGDHVHVSAGSNGRNQLTFRGSQYNASIHLNRYPDTEGAWVITRDEKTGREKTYCASVKRVNVYTLSDDAPPSYRAKMLAEVIRAVSAHLAAHPELLLHAEAKSCQTDVDRAQGEVDELEKKLTEARAKLKAARSKLRRAALALPAEDQVAADAEIDGVAGVL